MNNDYDISNEFADNTNDELKENNESLEIEQNNNTDNEVIENIEEDNEELNRKNKINIVLTILTIFIISFVLGFIGYIIYYNSDYRKNKINSNNNKNEKIEQVVSYKCNEGYELIDNKCIMKVEDIEPNIEYYCDNGYQLSNGNCTKQEYNSEYVVTWNCPSGYEMGKDREVDICYKYTKIPVSIQKYYCPNGYTLYGTKCRSTTSTSARVDYLCDKGYGGNYNKSDGLCHYMTLTTTCSPGAWIVERYSNKMVKCVSYPTLIYSCDDGSITKTPTCSTTDEIDANYLMGCSGEYKLDQVNDVCVKTEYDVPSYTISCKNGYKLVNDHCVRTISKKAYQNTSCANGYEFIDNRCIKYDIQEPIQYYE